MQVLGGPPRLVAAIFAQVFHHQTDVLQVADARFGMTEPKALRMRPDKLGGAFDQLRRRRRGRRHLAQFIRDRIHGGTISVTGGEGNDGSRRGPMTLVQTGCTSRSSNAAVGVASLLKISGQCW